MKPIERMARAIHESRSKRHSPLEQARAALKAIEEPSDIMLRAGAEAARIGDIRDIWDAMFAELMNEDLSDIATFTRAPPRDVHLRKR